jgi:hypothetical protein
MAHPTLTMTHEGTPQNLALWKVGFENRVLRIILGPKRGEWRKLHYEEA